MIPHLTKGASIKGTALYVLHDEREGWEKAAGIDPDMQTADRVGFTATRNLSTDNPDLAWRLMCATAKNADELKRAAGIKAGGRKAQNFVGHLSLSWEQQTRPDRAEMLKAAEGALKALGWERLQALIVQHKEKDHDHIHIVVNLVDPETGQIAPTGNDFKKVQAWAHDYDEGRGVRVCHERAAKIEKQRAGQKPNPRKPWLSHEEWKQAKEAARQQAADLWDRQQGDRGRLRAEAVQQIRGKAGEVRDQYRPQWSALYKRQRDEAKRYAQAERALRQVFSRELKSPAGRAAFYNRNRAMFAGVQDGQRFGNMQAVLNPRRMQAAFDSAMTAQAADLTARHEAARAALSASMEQARHAGQREVWADHAKRLDALKAEQRLERDAARVRGVVSAPTANENRPEAPKVQAVPAPASPVPARPAGSRSRAVGAYDALKAPAAPPKPATAPQAAEKAADAARSAGATRSSQKPPEDRPPVTRDELAEQLRRDAARARSRRRTRDRER